MRAKILFAIVCCGLCIGLGDSRAAPQRGVLSVASLERALADWQLGCGGCPTRFGWGERELALFVAGRLASLGFATSLARSEGEWWVLVRLDQDGLLPVLPGLPPLERDGQFTRGVYLGRIPWAAPGVLLPRYLSPDEVLALPANAVPTVRLRASPTEPGPGVTVRFAADVVDPDGQVVLYAWDFGDGEGSWGSNPEHAYAAEGSYTVILTVVDDRGGTSMATLVVTVKVPSASPPPSGGGGCGCGR